MESPEQEPRTAGNRKLNSGSIRRWIGRMRRIPGSRPLLFTLAALLVLGGFIAGSADFGQGRAQGEPTRLDSFREAASPFSLSFLEDWWTGSSRREEQDALVLIPDEVRKEYFRELPFGEIIHEKAQKYEVDPALIAAIVEVESSFDTSARSARGAVGLMQLRPSTGRWMGARDLLDPSQNIDAGTKYLKYLEQEFDGDLDRQLAAYNAGISTVRRYGGVPPYPETARYIRRVMRRYAARNRELEEFNQDWIERGEERGSAD